VHGYFTLLMRGIFMFYMLFSDVAYEKEESCILKGNY
jgi:hypothetical protein